MPVTADFDAITVCYIRINNEAIGMVEVPGDLCGNRIMRTTNLSIVP